MADNVDITSGAGTSVATDQVSGTNEHVQLFKLAYSADGSRVLVQVDANGMLVNVGTSALPTGAATAARQDTGNVSIASVDTKTPALGQQLAAASSPVVLTAAQITTLTPPAAITGFGTEATQLLQATAAKQDTAQTSLTTIATDVAPLITAQGAVATSVAGPLVQGIVSDAPESYLDATVRPLSLTAEGRLRVATVPSDVNEVWQHTFDNPWPTDDPWEAGAVSYV